MPSGKPVYEAGLRTGLISESSDLRVSYMRGLLSSFSKQFAKNRFAKARRQGLRLSTAVGSFLPFTSYAFANTAWTDILTGQPLIQIDTNAILMLAVFGGAMSFALLSAFWMIRERGRIIEENRRLKLGLADLRALNDRNEALANKPNQRTIVWNNVNDQPVILGNLPEKAGVPASEKDFLSFGTWMNPDSSSMFEPLLRDLRADARPFDTVVKSRNGTLIEVNGGTSGGFAFVIFNDLSAERQEHARLKSQHDSLQTTFTTLEGLLQKIPLPVWLRRDNSTLSWVNRAYAEAVESEDPRDVVSRDVDLLDSEVRERIEAADQMEKLYSEEIRATVAGDRKKLQVFNMRSTSGSAGIAIDKSDLEEVRKALGETNEGHARMLDQIATAIAIFDKSKRLIFYNNSFQQMWQLEASFLESEPSNAEVLDAMRDGKLLPDHPDWRKWREEQLDIYQALEPNEDWWHLLDGQTLRVVTTPQNTGGANWIFENVTEKLALESNYNALIRVQGETLDHLNEAVAVFGSDGKLRLFNPALEELWSQGELVVSEGLHISKIISNWKASVSNAQALKVILGKVTGFDDTREEFEGRIELANKRTLEYSVVPLPEGQSMLTFTDITASVNFENALRERAEALEESDLLKGKFIQHVSYQLRAPLTSISGFGELLSTSEIGSLNNKQEEYLGHINSAVMVLRTLVDDILDLASIDAGTMRLERTEIDFNECVDQTLYELAEPLNNKGLQVEVKVSGSCKDVYADPDRLRQILINLMSNAIDFSPDGGTITVSGKTEARGFVIRVIDEGPGIDKDERDRVFDRFEARSATGGRQGTGLGLSIIKGFVELHGGTITIEDGNSRGACFVCSFPHNTTELDESTKTGGLNHPTAVA